MENFISNEPRKSSCIGGGRLSVTFNSANKPENLPISAIHDTVYPCLVNPCKRGTKMVEVHATPVQTLPHSSVSFYIAYVKGSHVHSVTVSGSRLAADEEARQRGLK